MDVNDTEELALMLLKGKMWMKKVCIQPIKTVIYFCFLKKQQSTLLLHQYRQPVVF